MFRRVDFVLVEYATGVKISIAVTTIIHRGKGGSVHWERGLVSALIYIRWVAQPPASLSFRPYSESYMRTPRIVELSQPARLP